MDGIMYSIYYPGIPSSYLTKYGRDNVLYDALLPSLYTKDIEVKFYIKLKKQNCIQNILLSLKNLTMYYIFIYIPYNT